MAYTPINWQNGDTITAEKMNKMDNGWGVANVQLFSEVAPTVSSQGLNLAQLTYAELIEDAVLIVTYDGYDYSCPRIEAFDAYFYGGFTEQGPDFSQFPFAIQSSPQSGNTIFTKTAGEHAVSAVGAGIEIGNEFEKAVKAVINTLPKTSFRIIPGQTTWIEARDAVNAGSDVYVLYSDGNRASILFVGSNPSGDYVARGIRLTSTGDAPYAVQLSASSPDGVLQ